MRSETAEVVPRPPASIELGDIRVQTPVILAPMAGVTDAAFRKICREFGELPLREVPDLSNAPAGLYVAEMVTARALLEGSDRAWAMVQPDPTERIRSVQLYGTEPTSLAVAAGILVDRRIADHVDLNFGCPGPKVTRKGGGAAIPWKRDLFAQIVTQVRESVDKAASVQGRNVPLTVKMRIGIDDDHVTVFDAARIAQNAGVDAVGLHSRTQEQYYSGRARWEWITRLKEQMSIPVFGNGDIFSGQDAQDMLDQTDCDAVIVGRGCQGRPWLFSEITAKLWNLPEPARPTLRQVRDVLLQHALLTVEHSGNEDRTMREMRKHVGWYLKGFAVGGESRRNLNLVTSLEDLETRLNELDLDQAYPPSAEGARGRAGTPKKPHLPHGWLDSQQLTEEEREGLKAAEDGVSGG